MIVKLLDMPKLFSSLESDQEMQIEFKGHTVRDLLHHLSMDLDPKRKALLMNSQGEVSPELSIFIDGKSVSESNEIDQDLHEGNIVELVLAGG